MSVVYEIWRRSKQGGIPHNFKWVQYTPFVYTTMDLAKAECGDVHWFFEGINCGEDRHFEYKIKERRVIGLSAVIVA